METEYVPSCFDCVYGFIVEDLSVGIGPGIDNCKHPEDQVQESFEKAVEKLLNTEDEIKYLDNLGFDSHEEFFANRCGGFSPTPLDTECFICGTKIVAQNKGAYPWFAAKSLIDWELQPVCSENCRDEANKKLDDQEREMENETGLLED